MSDTGSSGIACIGWGSLVYDWRDLPCGAWHNDGPMLPVEFARESGVKPGLHGTRITLVICPDVERVQTCWSLLDVEDLSAARVSLARREDVVNNMERDIGYWDRKTGKLHGLEAEAIGQWASARGLAAAVWTSLGFGFKGNRGVMPEGPEVVEFLRKLDAAKRPAAEDYVRCAPAQIDTAYRRLIAQELRWTPRDCGEPPSRRVP